MISRDECIEAVRYLNPRLSFNDLEALSEEQLRACYVHLRAIRMMRLNDFARLGVWAEARSARRSGSAESREPETALLSIF